jgi:predicted permease
MRALLARFRDLFRRRTLDRAFDEEMSFHLAELEGQHLARGASPEEARNAAMREFGNVLRAREDLRSQAGFPTWDELTNDLKYAWRGITRRLWLAGSVFVILALGLGAAATIYGLIDAVFLRPLPVPHPEELYAVVSPEPGVPDRLSRGTVRRLEAALPDRSVAAYGGGARCTVQFGAQAATRANARLVNGAFFATLGIAPAAGRLLAESDDVPGAPTNAAVASYAWAQKNLATPDAAIGRKLVVNRNPVTIVGVLPAGFREVSVGQTTDFWFATSVQSGLRIHGNSSTSEGDDRPNDPDWNLEERISWLQILLRVRPGDPAPAPALQRAWEPQRDDLILAHVDPREREQLRHLSWQLVSAPGGQSRLRNSFRSTGWLLSGIVGVMLVLVCMNVSGLLLVRSMSRHREIGVRLALGAGSFRVVRLGFLEAAILSAAGGMGGWLLAMWLLPAAVHLLAPGRDLDVTLGLGSIVWMTGFALFSAFLSSLAPAMWISRVQPLSALSGNHGLGRAPLRLGRILVVVQFALAVALVALATALGGELQRSLAADPGFERDRVVTALFDATSAGYEAKAVFPLLERLRSSALNVPGVKAVSFSTDGILAGSQSLSGVYVRDPRARVQERHFQHDSVLPGYFGVVGMPLLMGRDFAESDQSGSLPVAVVSAAFAREVFGGRNPIGQSFGFDAQPTKDDRTIVGVVADVRVNGVREPAPPMFYTPAAQWSDAVPQYMAIRFEGPEAAVQENLRAVLARTEPGLVLAGWKTLKQRMTDDLSGDLATTRLAAIFGTCAVLLAGAGVAGSLGYLVVLRQRELALRMAIGAAPGLVFRSVLTDSLRLSALGCALGIAAVWLVPQLPAVKSILYGQPGVGPALLAAAIALATATVAGWIPARRAARIDPILLLKSE